MKMPALQDRAAARRSLLGELAEIGMALARDLPRQAAAPDADLDAIALKYSRISRAVRQTLALEARFEQESLEVASRVAKQRGARRKRDVEQLVIRAIESEFSEGVARHLVEKLEDRLEDDLDEDYAQVPVAILAAQICHALGVPFDPAPWEEEEDAPTPARHPGFAAGEDRDPSTPCSNPSRAAPPHAGVGHAPETPTFPEGGRESGHDEADEGDGASPDCDAAPPWRSSA